MITLQLSLGSFRRLRIRSVRKFVCLNLSPIADLGFLKSFERSRENGGIKRERADKADAGADRTSERKAGREEVGRNGKHGCLRLIGGHTVHGSKFGESFDPMGNAVLSDPLRNTVTDISLLFQSEEDKKLQDELNMLVERLQVRNLYVF